MKKCFVFFLTLIAVLLCACSSGQSTVSQPVETPAATAVQTAAPLQSGSGIETIALFKDIHYYEYSEDGRLFCRVEYPVLQMSSKSSANQALGSTKNTVFLMKLLSLPAGENGGVIRCCSIKKFS